MLTPIYVETRDTGLATTTPTNLRTGLPTTTETGGGYAQELTINVTGVAGSRVLTSTETTKVAGLGAIPFAAVLNAADGSNDVFATVLSHNGSNQITIRHPLASDFTGTLSSKYDAALGQHLTKAATRAYIQHAANYSGATGGKGDMIAGTWELLPPVHNQVWGVNPALASYGASNSASPVVQSNLNPQTGMNIVNPADRVEAAPSTVVLGVEVGTHKKGHGATATIYTGMVPATVSFWLATRRSVNSVADYTPRVIIKGDGIVLYDVLHDGWLHLISLPVSGYSTVTIDITNENEADEPYYLRLSDLMVRHAGQSGRVGQGKVVMLGDSWFGYYDGLAAKVLAEKTGATVISRGLGGTTTEWAMSWFHEYVVKEQPDEVWIHFFTNDLNRPSGTFTAPDGTEKPLWKNTAQSYTEAQVNWAQNIQTLIHLCLQNGVRPVIFMPGGTASDAQTLGHCNSVSRLDRATLKDKWQATPAELTDATASVNTVGKFIGRQVMVGALPKYASGPLAADPWV